MSGFSFKRALTFGRLNLCSCSYWKKLSEFAAQIGVGRCSRGGEWPAGRFQSAFHFTRCCHSLLSLTSTSSLVFLTVAPPWGSRGPGAGCQALRRTRFSCSWAHSGNSDWAGTHVQNCFSPWHFCQPQGALLGATWHAWLPTAKSKTLTEIFCSSE